MRYQIPSSAIDVGRETDSQLSFVGQYLHLETLDRHHCTFSLLVPNTTYTFNLFYLHIRRITDIH